MITHNGTYLLHATHHGMPIYAATLGGKMVIGGWLLSATLQAIVAALGAEGTEVIAKTNDYLNRIATTDPQRALLLAGFINEDPMLVCSLVETSKVRYLVGDGTAYIVTNHAIGVHPRIIIEGYYCTLGNACIFQPILDGALKQDGWVTNPDGNMYYRYGANSWNGTRGMGTITGQRMNLDLSDRMIRDGVEYGSPITGYNFANYKDYNMRLWGAGWSGSRTIEMGRVKMYDDSEQYLELVPCQHGDQSGMLDIVSLTFYPNANTEGSFTITLTDKA